MFIIRAHSWTNYFASAWRSLLAKIPFAPDLGHNNVPNYHSIIPQAAPPPPDPALARAQMIANSIMERSSKEPYLEEVPSFQPNNRYKQKMNQRRNMFKPGDEDEEMGDSSSDFIPLLVYYKYTSIRFFGLRFFRV